MKILIHTRHFKTYNLYSACIHRTAVMMKSTCRVKMERIPTYACIPSVWHGSCMLNSACMWEGLHSSPKSGLMLIFSQLYTHMTCTDNSDMTKYIHVEHYTKSSEFCVLWLEISISDRNKVCFPNHCLPKMNNRVHNSSIMKQKKRCGIFGGRDEKKKKKNIKTWPYCINLCDLWKATHQVSQKQLIHNLAHKI